MADCEFPGCGRPYAAKGLCVSHWKQQRDGRPLTAFSPRRSRARGDFAEECSVEGCSAPDAVRGYCKFHYRRLIGGVALDKPRRREGVDLADPSTWNRTVDSKGYVLLKVVVNGVTYRTAEHTHIMESYLGRRLVAGEEVHHKNGDRADNRIENLELWSTSQPKGQRVIDKLAWAKEMMRLYDMPTIEALFKKGGAL